MVFNGLGGLGFQVWDQGCGVGFRAASIRDLFSELILMRAWTP